MDFGYSDKAIDIRDQVAAFLKEHIYPNEEQMMAEIATGDRWQPIAYLEELKGKAKAQRRSANLVEQHVYGSYP